MRNIKLLIEYDGTNYVGWQRQENGKSIQGEIESVLHQMLQEKVNVIGAGRTDAGVHAHGQVANFRTETNLDLISIKGGLNGMLPEDIVVQNVQEVSLDFHARYSAKERQYSYTITCAPLAMMRNYSWYVKYSLDIDLMKKAASAIAGKHDFESFCKVNSEVDHHFCNVNSAMWQEEGSLLRLKISADRFLHGMVRALVGTMVDIGRGYTPFEDLIKILKKKNRAEAGMSAPAKGLVLEEIIY
jgi:tRNA pseudouridine38-40 synthase